MLKNSLLLTLENYLRDLGISQQSSCVDAPQQNGVTKRKDKSLLEVARSLLFTYNISKHFCGEAVFTVAYLIKIEWPLEYFPQKTIWKDSRVLRKHSLDFHHFHESFRVYSMSNKSKEVSFIPIPKSASFLVIHQHERATDVFHLKRVIFAPL